ncbi:Cof-type HAD-IIB family hydrolase [Erysipelotrichaceae bacterium RD49]|nr:Cof-type HAD-IIB family hydrolase [Erysipelotrichaceae bacterium RD49]
MIKAIFLDVDHTLYSHAQKKIPDDALAAVRAFQAKGGKAFLATGRHISEMADLNMDHLGLDGYVMMNGAVILDRDFKPVAGIKFEGESLRSLLNLFEQRKRPVVLLEANKSYINYADDWLLNVWKEYNITPAPLACWSGEPLYGGVAYVSRQNEAQFKQNELGPGIGVERWGDFGVDLTPHSGGKAYGLQEVCEVYGLKPEELMAFGDADNDISMLQFAGIGVAMGNALDQVKQAADYVTDDIDQGGVAKALEHFGLV